MRYSYHPWSVCFLDAKREKDLEKRIIIHGGKFLVSGSQIVLWSQISVSKKKQFRYYKEMSNTWTSVDCVIKFVLCVKMAMWAMNSVNLIYFLMKEHFIYIMDSFFFFFFWHFASAYCILQSQTMQMMYQVIAQEIKSMQLDAHPSDYLNFYCLGNREEVPSSLTESISATDKVVLQRTFFCYV